jgi:hypothetical protein
MTEIILENRGALNQNKPKVVLAVCSGDEGNYKQNELENGEKKRPNEGCEKWRNQIYIIARYISPDPQFNEIEINYRNNNKKYKSSNRTLLNARVTKLNKNKYYIVELNKIYTPLDIAACLFNVEKTENILSKESAEMFKATGSDTHPEVAYLAKPVASDEMNSIIARIYCWNLRIAQLVYAAFGNKRTNNQYDGIKKDMALSTWLETLTRQDWVSKYQQLEKKRSSAMIIGLIIQAAFTIAPPITNWVMYGPVLFLWRRIISGAQTYLTSSRIINESIGCYKFDISPTIRDKSFEYRYRAFLKQTVCIPLDDCIIKEAAMKRLFIWAGKISNKFWERLSSKFIKKLNVQSKYSISSTPNIDNVCVRKIKLSRYIFKNYCMEYTFDGKGKTPIQSERFNYTMLNFVILSGRTDLLTILQSNCSRKQWGILLKTTCHMRPAQDHCDIAQRIEAEDIPMTGREMLQAFEISKREINESKVDEGNVGDVYDSSEDSDYSSDDSSYDSYNGGYEEGKKEEEELILKF